MRAHDAQSDSAQELDPAQHLLAEHRVGLQYGALGRRQPSLLAEDLVGNADLAHVVQKEAVLDARVVEERVLDRARELGGVPEHALRVCTCAEVLRLERGRECANGLAVRMLQQSALSALDLEHPAQILRVELQLLGRLGEYAPERLLFET